MAVWKKLPMGIEQFEEIRRDGYYYVDKTGLIRVLMENGGKANLFTRPRRFGKSLNMSMLRSFFEIGCDGKLFDGLEIAGEKELCEKFFPASEGQNERSEPEKQFEGAFFASLPALRAAGYHSDR